MVAWEDAKVHVLTHGLHYGTGVFEGIRAYETPQGTGIFRHREHLERLFKSAELYYMPIPYTLDELRTATHELIVANELRECYIRPIAFRGYGQMGLYPLEAPVEVSIAAWPWGAYLGEDGKLGGIRAKVASWRRIPHDALIPHAKASGQYLTACWPRSRRPRPATRRRSCSTTMASCAKGRARTCTPSATVRSPPRGTRRGSWMASRVARSSRSPPIWATSSSSGRWPGQSCTSPTRCS